MMKGDLHTHSTFSDGALAADWLPRLAAASGLTHLAISDHDTLRAVEYARSAPERQGVTLIPAAELTGLDTKRGRRVHLLCYAPEPTDELAAFCERMRRARDEAAQANLDAIERRFPQFSRALALELCRDAGVCFKAHIMRVLFEFGLSDGLYGDVYHALKSEGLFRKVRYEPVEQVLSIARRAGAAVVMAHPSVYRSMELFGELAAAGEIDGVEIDHPRNTLEDKILLSCAADQYGLIVTGGSDFHGLHSGRPVPIGMCTTDGENIARILETAASRKGAPVKAPQG